jgi:hypothetical protein
VARIAPDEVTWLSRSAIFLRAPSSRNRRFPPLTTERIDHQPELVDEVALHQGLDESRAADREEVLALLPLQLRHRIRNVPLQQGGVLPLERLCQRRGCDVDLRNPESRDEVALTSDDLRGPHDPCQAVGLAAHQLGLHGVIAPAATGLGETLALFERHLPATEVPTLLEETLWDQLPPDPRVLRLAEDIAADEAGG